MNKVDFIAAVLPGALLAQKRFGIPASVTIAQGALESGWGASRLATQGFNLFGVKADAAWRGPVLSLSTTEYVGGKPVAVLAKWRKYGSWTEAIEDRSAFLRMNKRYAGAFGQLGEAFARALALAGYATDPNYADKVIAVMHSNNLTQYDKA